MGKIYNKLYKMLLPKQAQKAEIASKIARADIDAVLSGRTVRIPFINEYGVDEIFLDESGRLKAKIRMSVKDVQRLLQIKADYEAENSVELQNYELGRGNK